MTTRDSSTAAALAFQAEIASAKARRDRDLPRHSTRPPATSGSDASAPPAAPPATDDATGIDGKAA